ncbi:hypothetical protein Tco_0485614 [Tanacetum coccineum]
MPIDSNKPPNPLFSEICNLTKMTSADKVCNASFNDTKVKVIKNKHCKPYWGVKIKVSYHGSTGAGFVYKRSSFRLTGVCKDRDELTEGYPTDNRGGKHLSNSLMNDEINKVLSGLTLGSINSNLKFSMGRSIDFAPFLLDNAVMNKLGSLVAKSCGLKTSLEHTGMGDVGSAGCGLASSKDGIAIAETGIKCDKGIEEMALKMEYDPGSVCKLENRNRRISFSTEEVYKGG